MKSAIMIASGVAWCVTFAALLFVEAVERLLGRAPEAHELVVDLPYDDNDPGVDVDLRGAR